MSGSASELEPIVQEEVKFPEGSRIIPIHPASKYVVLAPAGTDLERLDRLAKFMSYWWDSNIPFLILTDEITLVKVGEVDLFIDEEDGDCDEKA